MQNRHAGWPTRIAYLVILYLIAALPIELFANIIMGVTGTVDRYPLMWCLWGAWFLGVSFGYAARALTACLVRGRYFERDGTDGANSG